MQIIKIFNYISAKYNKPNKLINNKYKYFYYINE